MMMPLSFTLLLLRLLLPILFCLVSTTGVAAAETVADAVTIKVRRGAGSSSSSFNFHPPPSLCFSCNCHRTTRSANKYTGYNAFNHHHVRRLRRWNHHGVRTVATVRPTESLALSSLLAARSRSRHHHQERQQELLQQNHPSGRRWKGRYEKH